MSFICEGCEKPQGIGSRPNKTVTETRKVSYKNGNKVTYGTEIVKEVNLCDSCVQAFKK